MIRLLCVVLLVLALPISPCRAGVAPPTSVTGPKQLLVVAVRFKDVSPSVSMQELSNKADKVGRYIQSASYGKVSLSPRMAGWYELPGALGDYRISPHNYRVDRHKVRKLLSRALGAARADGIKLGDYDLIWIVVGVRTGPGKGYGMIAYCANPGMLCENMQTGIRNKTINLAGGGSFSGPAVVSAENAHVGHVAHDLLHAMGGTMDGKRAVPDLYDFQLQSNPPAGAPMLPETFAIHAGPWGIMSQHFINWRSPPPHPMAFTRLQLGWISPDQIIEVEPGQERQITLAPLSSGTGTLAVRVRFSATRSLLLENRQPFSADVVLPEHGLIVSRIDANRPEGGGIVKVVDAVPATKSLNDAAFIPDDKKRSTYVDKGTGTAVVVRSRAEDGSLHIVVTTPENIVSLEP